MMFSDPTLTVGGAGNGTAGARELSKQSEESGLDGSRLAKGLAVSPPAVRQVSENQTGAPPTGKSSHVRRPGRPVGVYLKWVF
jgi:hypothetical protein